MPTTLERTANNVSWVEVGPILDKAFVSVWCEDSGGLPMERGSRPRFTSVWRKIGLDGDGEGADV